MGEFRFFRRGGAAPERRTTRSKAAEAEQEALRHPTTSEEDIPFDILGGAPPTDLSKAIGTRVWRELKVIKFRLDNLWADLREADDRRMRDQCARLWAGIHVS